jgi:DNA (cytosine-5)-methyltransferase 1
MVKRIVIDLFCGAGTATGIHLANCDSEVVACVNHDAKAIKLQTQPP